MGKVRAEYPQRHARDRPVSRPPRAASGALFGERPWSRAWRTWRARRRWYRGWADDPTLRGQAPLLPERIARPGERLPCLPDDCYPPDSVPLDPVSDYRPDHDGTAP